VDLFQQAQVAQLEGVERLRRQRREAGLDRRQPGARAELEIEEGVVQVEQDGPNSRAAGRCILLSAATVQCSHAHPANGTGPRTALSDIDSVPVTALRTPAP
jgi:hypothetical protein